MAHVKNQDGSSSESLRKQLAVAVRSSKWSYAVFWSPSATQQGVLEWGDGYYNGDSKTKKIVQGVEVKSDRVGLQRSKQLRELYLSLLDGEIDVGKKPSPANLSPEDLTDAEWYYLVCMSFVFNLGQCLPGRVLGNGETIWLCNAQFADSKVFSRSLLAKSASIQTVVCFPHLGGVIELGVIELVTEDPTLLQHMKACLLDFSKPDCFENSSSPLHSFDDDDDDPVLTKIDHDLFDTLVLENTYSEEMKFDLHENMDEIFKLDSPDECSKGCDHNHQAEDSFMLQSPVQSWPLDDFGMDVQDSISSAHCLSEALCKGSPDNQDADLHYRRTVSAILESSNQTGGEREIRRKSQQKDSSFSSWKNEVSPNNFDKPQNILKKMLHSVPLMHISRKETQDIVSADKKHENNKFHVSKSRAPSINESEKASILNETIKYLKTLEARVEELESCIESVDFDAKGRRNHNHNHNHLEMVEQTSDNYYDNKKLETSKRIWINKRKARDIVDETETETETESVVLEEGMITIPDVKVRVKDQEVFIEMKCFHREYVFNDIMDALNKLHLDALSVSSTLDGVLSLNLKSKFRGSAVAPAGMIKEALWKVAGK